jgi:hypothetical protein
MDAARRYVPIRNSYAAAIGIAAFASFELVEAEMVDVERSEAHSLP